MEALLTCQCHAGRIGLIVIDLLMPHLCGRSVARRLRRTAPDARLLFISGNPAEDLAGRANFLPKPLQPALLVQAVRDLFQLLASGHSLLPTVGDRTMAAAPVPCSG